MPAIVLESVFGSPYDDSPASYEFPSRYLRYFEPLSRGEPLFAVIYEPRGEDSRGRMAYVALAVIAGPPVRSRRTTKSGRPLWRVAYTGPALAFDQPVPREVLGEPVESWLRDLSRGRERNVATFGRAVRELSDADFQRIVQLGSATALATTEYPTAEEHETPLVAARERSERLVAVLERDARFRRNVLQAYGYQCSVSGFGLGRVSATKPNGLLEAAHIRPVWRDGPDIIQNGIPLTPTLHRLFDAGLFTVAYADGVPRIQVSQHLEDEMILSPDRGFEMRLRDDLPLLLPTDGKSWPKPELLRFHQENVFRG